MSKLDRDTLPEAFDEFDFFNRSNRDEIKRTLRKLQDNLSKFGRTLGETNWQSVDAYATSKGIKGERGVKMPAYGRLISAYQWLIKLEENERETSNGMYEAPAASSIDLPF